MNVPQPFQYQGSKRSLASAILRYLPSRCNRIVEPFCGSAALSLACAMQQRAREFWLNDCNAPLARLLDGIINRPEQIIRCYEKTWKADPKEALQQFYDVRDAFNRDQDPQLLLYLLARCVKGAVRYNARGAFNQSPDKRRLGTRPSTMRENILRTSGLLRGKTSITSVDYRELLSVVRPSDVVYLDPPYQGVCGDRDSRYSSGISSGDLVTALESLNRKNIRYVVSYDGRLGDQSYGVPLPETLDLSRVELEAGRSSQATLLGRNATTFESLYLSPALSREMGAAAPRRRRPAARPLQLFEPAAVPAE